MKIGMIGAGYVGLTTGVCLARIGHDVTVVDVDEARVNRLQQFDLPIYEPGLDEELKAAAEEGLLHFTARVQEAVSEAEAIFLAVGTPSRADGSIDLSQIEEAARMIAPYFPANAVVIVKSTVTAGTCRKLREIVAEVRRSLDFSVASNPEFLREGSALEDFMVPDRIVLGADDPHAAAILDEIYRPLTGRAPVVRTSTINAELTKHAANAFLATKIAFINEVADLCEKAGGDVDAIAEAIGLDRRIGRAFLNAGPGFGGSCFPKDTRAYAASGRQYGAPQTLIECVVRLNEKRKRSLAQRIMTSAGLRRGDEIAMLGAAFKANTDDVRESPALFIARELAASGIIVKIHDPKASANGMRHMPEALWVDCPHRAAHGVKAVVIMTEWPEYLALDLVRLSAEMDGSHLFDFRNLLDAGTVAAAGLIHHRVGAASRGRIDDAAALQISRRGRNKARLAG